MHDFDEEQAARQAKHAAEFGDKPFRFRGETFYVRANAGYPSIKRVAALSEASTGDETFSAIEESVISMIDPRDEAAERFLAATRNDDFPVTFADLVDLQNWLIAEQTGRPPTQEPPSAPTPTEPGTASTDPSSTEQGEASTS